MRRKDSTALFSAEVERFLSEPAEIASEKPRHQKMYRGFESDSHSHASPGYETDTRCPAFVTWLQRVVVYRWSPRWFAGVKKGRNSAEVSGRRFRDTRCECWGSESGDEFALVVPVGRQVIAQTPIESEAQRLTTFQHIADVVRRQESEVEHLLHAPLWRASRVGDLGECLARFEHLVTGMGAGNVAEQDVVDRPGDAAQNDLRFDPPLAGSKGCIG